MKKVILDPRFYFERWSDRRRAVYLGGNRVLCGRTFNGKLATYYVEADDRLLSPRFIVGDEYERGATSFLLRNLRRDSHCIDVGANFGYFSVMMGLLCWRGKTIGIEADPRIAEQAHENVLVNGIKDQCRILNRAVSDTDEDVFLFRRHSRSGNNSIAACGEDFTREMGEEPEERFCVSGLRLDDLLPEMEGRVDFLKVDVEGAELLALAGAEEMLATNSGIKLIMEWSPGQLSAAGFEPADLVALLRRHGFRPFKLQSWGYVDLSYEALLDMPYWANVLLAR